MGDQLRGLRRAAAWLVLCVGLFASGALPLHAEITPDKLPELTGRVVDDAKILKLEDQTALIAKLKDLEYQSSIQFVVAIVSSLQGEEIEPYANALFRKWKLGQKDKNNGLLFVVAPKERKIRFEVGYGLEGTLTDALTKLILRNAVGPKLKANDYAGGIKAGVDEIIAILTTDKSDWQKRPALRPATAAAQPVDEPLSTGAFVAILVVVLIGLILMYRFRRSINWTSMAAGSLIGSSSSSSSDSSSSSSDSFSGGGGDSGGGGSSDSY